MTATSNKRTPNARELIAGRQRRQKEVAPERAGKELKVVGKEPAVAVTNDEYRARYLDTIAPSNRVGRDIKYSPKDGAFIVDEEKVPEDATFAALCGETLVGFRKFNGPGQLPDEKMGLLYSGFVMPQVSTLPDRDQSAWELGLNGEVEDPWGHWMFLPLQNVATLEVDTFTTSSKTGRNAVGVLLKHFERLRKDHPGMVPLVQLRSSGFQHRDERIG
jgi:hypothetical protein